MITDEKKTIIESMLPMFKEAIEKKMWFYCVYEGIWFSPRQLFYTMQSGSFCWGQQNWRLRPPADYIKEQQKKIVECSEKINRIGEECSIPFIIE